ncbi:elongation factor P [Patescibacteria group bacterium]|nr:elongation factor P [Patescibacteria group bacterium]
MYGITDLKTGTKFILNREPHEVLSFQHSKKARGGGIMRTKLKNLITGAIFDKTFKGNDKFEPANVFRAKASFLYHDEQNFHFMDSTSYEQFTITTGIIGDKKNYLQEGMEVDLVKFDDKPIGIDLPIKITYEIIATEPGVKGDTAQGATKAATIATGASINVPLFINQGDKVVVDTRDGNYVERA